MKICAPLLLFLLLATCSRPEGGPEPLVIDGVRFVPMRAERLPDMHHPRSAHILEETGGLVLAAGGHTTGFIPEKSAEYLKDGKWVEVDMLYPHDAGFGLPLRDGRILLGGGYGESFGISQSWGTELWDPASRQFRPFPIMDRKRAHGAAVELAEGKIAVSGNWYNSDGIGVYSPGGTFNEAGWSAEQRSYPYMLRSDSDNALIFSSRGTRDEPLEGWVDRVYGDGFQEPLLCQWQPCHFDRSPVGDACFIGDMSTGHYDYLILASGPEGQFGILQIRGGRFSLLETQMPLPKNGLNGRINWCSILRVNRETGSAWLTGTDSLRRAYLARIGYAEALQGGKASVTIHYSEPLEALPFNAWDLLLADGRVLVAGGNDGSNYEPSAATYMLSTEACPSSGSSRWWIYLLLLALVVGLTGGWLLPRRHEEEPGPKTPAKSPDMMSRISLLMEEKELFRKPGLRLEDLARELGTNTTYISATINGQMGTGFPDYVAGYRIRYAQGLMRKYPSRSMAEIAIEAGFANEKTFFRTFKAKTGETPTEWRKSDS